MMRLSRARSIRYGWHKPNGEHSEQNTFNEVAMEKLLSEAKRSGIVSEYDTGRGAIVWFIGQPGKELRLLKKKVLALLPSDVEPL